MIRRHPQGQGLLELIIALGIIVSSLFATVGLILAVLGVAHVSKAQLLAIHLAREGIEVARSVRDANWLAIDAGDNTVTWSDNLARGTDYTAIPVFTPPGIGADNAGTWELDFSPDDGDMNAASNATRVWRWPDGASSTFLQTMNPNDLGVTLETTNYWRLLTLRPVCWDYTDPNVPPETTEVTVAGDGTGCPVDYTQVGAEANAHVLWQDRGRFHNLTLVEKIYDWKT